MVINEEISSVFGEDLNVPDKLTKIVNRLLNLEDQGNRKSQDAITTLIEGILEKSECGCIPGGIKDEKFLEWCEKYEG